MQSAAAMTEPTTAADVIDWPRSWDADAIAWVKRQIIGEYLREAEARQQDASALRSALRTALERLVGEVEWNGDIPFLVYGDQIQPSVWIEAREALAARAALAPSAPPALDERRVREAVFLSLDHALGPPSDGMSKAVRRAIEDEVVARLAQDRSPEPSP